MAAGADGRPEPEPRSGTRETREEALMDVTDAIVIEWLGAAFRWLHVVAAIAWIGTSFYFIQLDLSLRDLGDGGPARRPSGEAWQVHGGGFYRIAKYLVAPEKMPRHLAWFKWEAYATWLSGIVLMAIVYYANAELYLIDHTRLALDAWQAVGLSLGGLLFGWLAYEALCRSPLRSRQALLAAIGYLALVGLAYVFAQLFSGRGAFIQIGALIGTMMVANVFVVIIPNQKKVVRALTAGREPDPALGEASKLRSVHNNYLTLPVVFLMIGVHYPLFYATRYNWLIVAIVLALGPVIRHFFNARHAGKASPWWVWGVVAAGLLAVLYLSSAGPAEDGTADGAASRAGEPATFAEVEEIVVVRCAMCHGREVYWPGLATAPAGVLLDTPEAILRHARELEVAAVRSSAMPPGNITWMESAERRAIGSWLAAGAPAGPGGEDRR